MTQSSLLMHASRHFVVVEDVLIVWREVTSANPVAPLPGTPNVEASTIPVCVEAMNPHGTSSILLRQQHHSPTLQIVNLPQLLITSVQAVS